MSDYVFPQFDSDVRIDSIGPMFKAKDHTRWGVNLQLYRPQKKSSLTISNAPILARKRYLNPTIDHGLKGWGESFYISSTKEWQAARIGDCPIKSLEMDKRQFCFVVPMRDGKTAYLPQFEFGRILFFHDGYLSRTALMPECLDLDFNVSTDWSNNKAYIEIMPTSGYPLGSFNDLDRRNYLSWILLDEQARKSYESIGLHLKKYGYQSGYYRKWDFRFDPPELPGAYFSVRGWFDQDTNSIFVYEIDKIKRIKADIPDEIDMYHPEFTTPSQERNEKGTPVAPAGDISGFRLHDDEDANADSSRVIIQGDKVESEFSKAFITNRISEKKRKVSSVIPDGGESKGHVLDVSSEEPMAGQGRAGSDWNIIHDVTENTHLFESKFDCFLGMVNAMTSYDGCVGISKKIHPLPSVTRCTKYRLSTDGTPRCMAVIELEVQGKHVTLLEVDTSDAEKALSTKVLVNRNYSEWKDDLKKIMYELVRGSLVWPSKVLTQICGSGGHLGIKHPQCAGGHKGLLLPDTIEGWAGRFYGRILELLEF
ncbi:Tn7-like element transposition protein TnsE [Desulfovibrio sp. UCD-KL4C]|uniref:Tn7-like element transposition protein TnsE n=1 Tax=Desulfovibrio sp. UCD-KL4C TaxID=2578120 RepID=UPI0025B974BA|nr:Tn7-like element transposition protein TnsE [Desulfovibrio sp. UCD-KL4C]